MQARGKIPLSVRKATLEARLVALGDRLQSIGEELVTHVDPDWEELAAVREGDEVLEATGLAGQHEIRRIKAALHRIEAGDYGICVRCGADISEARLDALPFTPFCKECAT
jgi:RNA polymerase-binding transcription factor DksA